MAIILEKNGIKHIYCFKNPIMTSLPIIPNFTGICYIRDNVPKSNYDLHRYQYAKTSNPIAQLEPALIAYADSEQDIIAVVEYAYEHKIAIAVRTGGHQYSGFSSTSGDNILLDVSGTFFKPEDFSYDAINNLVTVGISYDLEKFNTALSALNLFLPHGVCKDVHLGGHVQTGGFGMLIRSFGILADYVVSFDIITAPNSINSSVQKITVTKTSNPDLFAAVLGGGPGNYGVLTHVTFSPLKDSDYPHSCGMYAITPYDKTLLNKLITIATNCHNDPNLSGDYDIMINVVSGQNKFELLDTTYDDYMRVFHPHIYGKDQIPAFELLFNVIQVTVQYAGRHNPFQPYDPSLFQSIRDIMPFLTIYKLSDKSHTCMSLLCKQWVFMNVREYDMPFIKRNYLCDRNLDVTNFPAWLANRVDTAIHSDPKNLKLVMQFVVNGGNNSKFVTNTNNGTTFDWRVPYPTTSSSTPSSTLSSSTPSSITTNINTNIPSTNGNISCGLIFDTFYRYNPALATTIQKTNDVETLIMGFNDHRFVWCTFEQIAADYNMADAWPHYYRPTTYAKLQQVKTMIDPNGVFSPNTFSIPILPPVSHSTSSS